MVVVIDPGHGGPSLGARGAFSLEKDIVLKISKKLGVLITKHLPDVELVYTRTTDTLISLEDRGTIANQAAADLFISIHANGNPRKEPFGTETFVMGIDKSDKNAEVALKENADIRYEANFEERYDGYDPNSAESLIMFAMMQNSNMDHSLHMAALVEDEMLNLKRFSRGVKQGPFLVLWKATMPSVLIEVGFITNIEEEKYIASEKGQDEQALAIFKALKGYKKRWDRIHNNTPAPTPKKQESPQKTLDKTNTPKQQPEVRKEPLKKRDYNGITYHVQIFSTSKVLPKNSREFRGLTDVEHYRYGDSYRYYAGYAKTEKEAQALVSEIRKKFPEAFLIKLRNGIPD
ncbi:MAG: N-acetylmuramoyl-L-alanine amidase family protein [Bacteroidales bacterium]